MESDNSLLLNKQNYGLEQKNNNNSFNPFDIDYKLNYINRKFNIKEWNYSIINALSLLINNNKMIYQIDNLKAKNNFINLDNKINSLKIKILSLFRTNNIYNSYLMKIVNHYLSDILIRKIIEKYPNNFENIKLSYKNVDDIFNKEFFLILKMLLKIY